MDSINLASGDNNDALSKSPRCAEDAEKDIHAVDEEKEINEKTPIDEITTQKIDDNEMKLKDRIAQCRNIIESLKLELINEKSKLEKDTKNSQHVALLEPQGSRIQAISTPNVSPVDLSYYDANFYSASVENKLNYDEDLMDYEKKLQRYQNTLHLAQMEKKNIIRKQMLAKAYKLKLLEVENQCNIELLRVQQSLQCLEPLKMIASKWNTSNETATDSYDYNTFELMLPKYPDHCLELSINANNTVTEDFDANIFPEKPQEQNEL